MSKLMISLLAATGMAFAGAVIAADTGISRDDYKARVDQAAQQFKVDKDNCKSMSGNAKDVCMEEAKGKEKIARAEAEAAYKNTDAARYDARVAHVEAEYAVAKEKCDDQTGNAKDVCVKEAKAAEVKGKADAKVNKVSSETQHQASAKTASARADAAEDKRDAEYKVAIEKCDSFAGAAKDRCIKDAKARYGKT